MARNYLDSILQEATLRLGRLKYSLATVLAALAVLIVPASASATGTSCNEASGYLKTCITVEGHGLYIDDITGIVYGDGPRSRYNSAGVVSPLRLWLARGDLSYGFPINAHGLYLSPKFYVNYGGFYSMNTQYYDRTMPAGHYCLWPFDPDFAPAYDWNDWADGDGMISLACVDVHS